MFSKKTDKNNFYVKIYDTIHNSETIENERKVMNEVILLDEMMNYNRCMKYFGDLKLYFGETYEHKAYEKKNYNKTENCKQILSIFWEKVMVLDKGDALPKDFFDDKKKPWASRLNNYKVVVEPIEKYEFYKCYKENDDAPAIFSYLETKKNKNEK